MIVVIGMLSALSTFAWLWITQLRTERHEPMPRRLATYAAAFVAAAVGLCGITAIESLTTTDAIVAVGSITYQIVSLIGAGVAWVGDSRVRV